MNDADFTGANLRGALFAGCHMERAALHCADLTGADFRAANLRRADLRGAVLAGAALNGAVLDQADMRAAYIAVPDANGCLQILPRRPGRPSGLPNDNDAGADFTNCAMRGVRLCSANLKGANFTGAVLEAADFTGAKVTGAVFHDAVLTGLAGAQPALSEEQPPRLRYSTRTTWRCMAARAGAALGRLQQAHAEWARASGGAAQGEPGRAGRRGSAPPGRRAFRARWLASGFFGQRRARAIGLDFSGAQLQGAVFDSADLRGAVFEGADLRGASFRGARLSHARFSRADLNRRWSVPNGKAPPAGVPGGDAWSGSTSPARRSSTARSGRRTRPLIPSP